MKREKAIQKLAYLLMTVGVLLVSAFATTLVSHNGLYFVMLAGCIVLFSFINYMIVMVVYDLSRTWMAKRKKIASSKPIPIQSISVHEEKKITSYKMEIRRLKEQNHDLTTQVSGINHLWGQTSQKNFALNRKISGLEQNLQQLNRANQILKKKLEKVQESQSRFLEAYGHDRQITELDIL